MLSRISRRCMLSRPGKDDRPCVATRPSISVALSEVMRRANWLKSAELRS